MTNLNERLQDAKGRIAERLHEMRGIQLTYTLFTDVTTDPPTSVVLTIFTGPTPSDWTHRTENGVYVEEITDTFFVSREALQSPVGTFHRPTTRDHFLIVGDTAAIKYKVRDVVEPDQYEAVYQLECHAERSKFARG